jgi:hypothetical protein
LPELPVSQRHGSKLMLTTINNVNDTDDENKKLSLVVALIILTRQMLIRVE